jgi:ADP-dependent NAD(P)H-hydrate dehydratase / NAD(P)H-hydrate epimerase
MQAIDSHAIHELGIPRLLLMDHAGLALARAVQSAAPSTTTPVLVCCGTGYNGGDGLAAARHLSAWGYPGRVILTGRLNHLREEPAAFARIVRALGLEIRECASASDVSGCESWFAQAGVIIDALLGIGTRGAVREPAASLIARMNGSKKPVIAADVPSGLDGDTGHVHGAAVRASATVTFGLPKHGLLSAEGPAHAGSLIVDPISIPQRLLVP